MDNFNLMPQVAQPVNRITTGQLPSELAELKEEALSQLGEDTSSSAFVLPSLLGWGTGDLCWCSYDGDDAE
jgi:bacteriocin leader peptide (microcyclamide/patellamide family)